MNIDKKPPSDNRFAQITIIVAIITIAGSIWVANINGAYGIQIAKINNPSTPATDTPAPLPSVTASLFTAPNATVTNSPTLPFTETPTSANLLQNGDFKNGLTNWKSWPDNLPVKITFEDLNGEKALCSEQIALKDSTPIWAGISQIIPVTGGTLYSMSVYIQSEATEAHMKVHWNINQDDMEPIKWDLVANTTQKTSDWDKIGGSYNAPANANYAKIYIWHGVVKGDDGKDTNKPGSKICVQRVSMIIAN